MVEARAFETAAYLARIGYDGDVAPTAETLGALHVAHLRAVPFENLDIDLGRPIRLQEAALFEKIVGRRRGGFCFELNGLFAALLRALGFDVSLLAAQFPREEGMAAPAFDHLTLLVWAEDGGGPWLADVGAGRGSFVRPLRLEVDAEAWRAEAGASFRLGWEGKRLRLMRRERGEGWERQYAFSLRPRRLADFEEGSRYHQTSPESPFTQGRICSLATSAGRVTLAGRRLIVTEHGERLERELADEEEYRTMLRELFGIELEAGEGGAGRAGRAVGLAVGAGG